MNHRNFSQRVFAHMAKACDGKSEEDGKVVEEGLRMLSFISDQRETHKKLIGSTILAQAFDSAGPERVVVYQLCATAILHLGLNPDNYEKLVDEPLARVARGLANKDDYFVQMDIVTMMKILLTSKDETIRTAAAKAYLETVIATTVASKYTNVITICGYILQYY